MAEKRVKVLLAGAECAPFAKIGGLADVLGTLPQELIRLGMDARVILPFHSQIKAKYAENCPFAPSGTNRDTFDS